MRIALHFDMIIDVEEKSVDELGKDIAYYLFREMFNGEDVLEIKYDGYDKISD